MAAERERENPFHLCCQSVPRELLRTRTGTQDSMNWLAEKDIRVKTRYFKVFLIGNFCKVEFC